MCGVMTEKEALDYRCDTLQLLADSGGVNGILLGDKDRIAFGVLSSSELMAVLAYMKRADGLTDEVQMALRALNEGYNYEGPGHQKIRDGIQLVASAFPSARNMWRDEDDGK